MGQLRAPKLLLKMMEPSQKLVDPLGWTLEAAGEMELHNDAYEYVEATCTRDTPESVPGPISVADG
jgi:hypothetical protein